MSRLLNSNLIRPAILDAFKKLNPKSLMNNPILCWVAIGSLVTTAFFVMNVYARSQSEALLSGQLMLWLWLTVLFSNFAEAIAEGKGKAQAEHLKKTRMETPTTRKTLSGELEVISSSSLKRGDCVVVKAGQVIPSDGTVVEGVASVDESAITGESAPVIREGGGDRSAVTGGTIVLSDFLVIQITTQSGESFLDHMIRLVEGAVRHKTPNEIALQTLLMGLTVIFSLVTLTLYPFAQYAHTATSIVVLIALGVCLIPTTIGGLLSAIGIAGMDRLVQKNVLALSGRAVEAAGDIDVLLLDKTGTITIGNRVAFAFLPTTGIDLSTLAEVAALASLADLTPEGRSILVLAQTFGIRLVPSQQYEVIPFTAETCMSGVNDSHDQIRKGSQGAIQQWIQTLSSEATIPEDLKTHIHTIASQGGTPLVVSKNEKAIGIIHLKDQIKPGIHDRFTRIRAMGIETVMITGDNALTAAAIAREAGVDDFLAEAKPENKFNLIQKYQTQGRRVAMTGDGTNDAPALAQSDVGLVMNTGTQAAREAGNMIDLDSDPTKMIEIVEIGKQLLITRGSLTTFSIANDVAKYFAILPAIFSAALPGFKTLNIMKLQSPESAILSAVIFNACIIIALIPLALRGVEYRPQSALQILQRNGLIYGLGGIFVPFVGIKLIDTAITFLGMI